MLNCESKYLCMTLLHCIIVNALLKIIMTHQSSFCWSNSYAAALLDTTYMDTTDNIFKVGNYNLAIGARTI